MRKSINLLAVLFFMFLVSTVSAQNIYLKAMGPASGPFTGMVKGDATAKGHENEIMVFSYSVGAANCLQSGQQAAGNSSCKPSLSGLNFMINLSEAINPLRHFLLTGTKLPTADFVFEKVAGDGAAVYYKIHMEDVTVGSLQESGAAGGGVPSVSVEFTPVKIAYGVYRQNASGNTVLVSSVGYNLATNSLWTYSF